MMLVGVDYWTDHLPAWPLLQRLGERPADGRGHPLCRRHRQRPLLADLLTAPAHADSTGSCQVAPSRAPSAGPESCARQLSPPTKEISRGHRRRPPSPSRPECSPSVPAIGVAGIASADPTPTPNPTATASARRPGDRSTGRRGPARWRLRDARSGHQELASKLGVTEEKLTEALRAIREENRPTTKPPEDRPDPASSGMRPWPRRWPRSSASTRPRSTQALDEIRAARQAERAAALKERLDAAVGRRHPDPGRGRRGHQGRREGRDRRRRARTPLPARSACRGRRFSRVSGR